MKHLMLRDKGSKVTKLQTQLKNWGLEVTIDGEFGPQTLNAVKDFQAKRSKKVTYADRPLLPNGVVDENTWAELFKIPVMELSKTLQYVTAEQLFTIANEGSVAEFEPFVEGCNLCLDRFDITTPLRIAHFIAQVFHESGCLKWIEELASGDAYEGRTDLGNTQPGDGRRFKGRGFIQLTGRSNYRRFSEAIGYDFEFNPRAVATPENAWLSAGWFWDAHDLNALADKDNFDGITLTINGGYNGYDDRLYFLDRAKKELIK